MTSLKLLWISRKERFNVCKLIQLFFLFLCFVLKNNYCRHLIRVLFYHELILCLEYIFLDLTFRCGFLLIRFTISERDGIFNSSSGISKIFHKYIKVSRCIFGYTPASLLILKDNLHICHCFIMLKATTVESQQ